jgi:hypothetical protein
VYTLGWSLSDGSSYGGVALQMGNVLAVGWGQSGTYGVVVYRVERKGGKATLAGKWTATGSEGLGTENLDGPTSLNGRYTIISASSTTGSSYSGVVDIRPTGDTYSFNWKLSNESYAGIGILKGDVLAVGWGSGASVGVVAYEVGKDRLNGVWATPTGTKLGIEELVRDGGAVPRGGATAWLTPAAR